MATDLVVWPKDVESNDGYGLDRNHRLSEGPKRALQRVEEGRTETTVIKMT
jgi:hypothetical protein